MAVYYLVSIFTHPHAARVLGGHIVYVTEGDVSFSMGVAYQVATGVAMALLSHRAMVVLAAVVIAGAYRSYTLYWAFVSVWCFIAAAASVIILAHFERARRRHLRAGKI